jgi:type I restriction enzyme S subunit
LRVKDKTLCFPKYLFYFLFSNYQKGGTIPFQNKTTGLHNLKTDDYVKKCDVPLPTLETQHQIAANLDKVTHTIDLCNAILEKLDLLVKSRSVGRLLLTSEEVAA